jgi:hypothetical protein
MWNICISVKNRANITDAINIIFLVFQYTIWHPLTPLVNGLAIV